MLTAKLVRLETAWSATPQPRRAPARRPIREPIRRGAPQRAAAHDLLRGATSPKPSASAVMARSARDCAASVAVTGGVTVIALTLEFHRAVAPPGPHLQRAAVPRAAPRHYD